MFEGSANQCRYDDDQDTKEPEKGTAVGLLEVSRTLYGVEDTEPPQERCPPDVLSRCPAEEQIATHVKCEVVQWASGVGHVKGDDQQQDLVHMERGAFEETRIVSNGKSCYKFYNQNNW